MSVFERLAPFPALDGKSKADSGDCLAAVRVVARNRGEVDSTFICVERVEAEHLLLSRVPSGEDFLHRDPVRRRCVGQLMMHIQVHSNNRHELNLFALSTHARMLRGVRCRFAPRWAV